MSYLSFKATSAAAPAKAGTLRGAFSQWILTNHGVNYRIGLQQQRSRKQAQRFKAEMESSTHENPSSIPMVGIVGGGFAGLFSGLILQSLGIECEVFESSERVGGRIRTWYSTNYHSDERNQHGLYGEIGGMRLPQFSADMLPVQQLALAVNTVLARNGREHEQVNWRKFYYSSPEQRLRFNNMPDAITNTPEYALNDLNFGQRNGGDIPDFWVTPQKDANGNAYLPVNMVLDQVNGPFLKAFDQSFANGFELLMQFDQYSMWDYLTTQFKLGDMGEYYNPAMGPKNALLPWSVASYLETTNVGSGMYAVSFVEMVIAVYDWGGSKDPYRPNDQGVYMLTVDKGMQHFPDACRAVLDLEKGVRPKDGVIAQIQVGMLPTPATGTYIYNPPNLTDDARPLPPTVSANSASASTPKADTQAERSREKRRVHLRHKAIELKHDSSLFDGHGGMRLKLQHHDEHGHERLIDKVYPYVITTLPMGAYLNGADKLNLLNDVSFSKAQAIRECNYMSSFKAFLTFKTQFWTKVGERQEGGYGAATTDRPNRQIIYPSYGYDSKPGVLQVYCWAGDARKLGALGDKERIEECLKGIQYLYPDVDIYQEFAGYHDGKTTKTWFWDEHAGGGAFALFNPGQFNNLYPTLLTPEFDGCLNFAGECCSVHHGWIVGALDSAYNAVLNILQQAGATKKIQQMRATWGSFTSPDVEGDPATANQLSYAYLYNQVDREAAAIPANASASIYGDSTYVFEGNVPAFIADYSKVPQSMKAVEQDKQVLQMLNNQWNDNVAQRAKLPPVKVDMSNAVAMLESIYYGNNFQTIPAPAYWLKDDDEFARQQLAGFMPNLLSSVNQSQLKDLLASAGLAGHSKLNQSDIRYVADYRQYLQACTVIPSGYYLAQPIVFFTVSAQNELLPVAIQLEQDGEVFTPDMANAENAWLLAKMQTNCAGQTLHDVGFHQLLTHQIGAMVSIALFSEEVFNPATEPRSTTAFQQHPVFKLLSPHLSKTVEFQQTIYDSSFHPYAQSFPDSREVNGKPGVYNIGFIYDLIFSCGRIGNYQLQDKMYNDDGKFRFLDLAIPKDAQKRGVSHTPFSYPYVHDATLWYEAMQSFISQFVDTCYPNGDSDVADDVQLQRFFNKLIPAFNYVDGVEQAQRFPASVTTAALLKEVLTMFVWQFSVQHTVINDGAYNQAAFVPNASTLMYAPPADTPSSQWTPADILACLPSQTQTYPDVGGMNFLDIQLNASVTGQGPYPETVFGRGVLEPSIDYLQDTYSFTDPALRTVVDQYYQDVRKIAQAIQLRQAKDIANYFNLYPHSDAVPATVLFDLITPVNVMNTIQT